MLTKGTLFSKMIHSIQYSKYQTTGGHVQQFLVHTQHLMYIFSLTKSSQSIAYIVYNDEYSYGLDLSTAVQCLEARR